MAIWYVYAALLAGASLGLFVLEEDTLPLLLLDLYEVFLDLDLDDLGVSDFLVSFDLLFSKQSNEKLHLQSRGKKE